MLTAGTPSSQTVCQMPETGVYQMPAGRSTCLPRCCRPESDGSHTETSNSFSPSCRAGVISKLKGR